MIILGFDPGTAVSGYGVISLQNGKCEVIGYGYIKTSKAEAPALRLVTIYNELNQVINSFQPTEFAIEGIYFYKNAKSVIKIGEVKGIAMLASAIVGIPVYEYTPIQIKEAVTGFGRASKEQIIMMVTRLLNLKVPLKSTHSADALATALCHINMRKLLTALPKE